MRKTSFSFCLTDEMKKDLLVIASSKGVNLTSVIIDSLNDYLKKNVVLKTNKKVSITEIKMSKEDHKKDWEFRKKMVKEGKLDKSVLEVNKYIEDKDFEEGLKNSL